MKTTIPANLKGKAVFDYLVKNKSAIIDLKKGVNKRADLVQSVLVDGNDITIKGKYLYENNDEAGIIKRTIIMNTYLWLDTHDDVHMPNLFAKSIQERGKRIPHLHDHIFEISAKVGKPIGWSEREIKWKELGIDKSGSTMALFLESEIRKEYNAQVYREYLNGDIDQHSVSMRYVKVNLAVNDEDYKEEYKVWQEVAPKLGNLALAEKQGYFFAVREAVLNEGSAVLLGSNELTPTLGEKAQPLSTGSDKPRKALDITSLVGAYKF